MLFRERPRLRTRYGPRVWAEAYVSARAGHGLLVLALVAAVGCMGADRDGVSSRHTASVTLSYLVPVSTRQVPCASHLKWRMERLAASGSEGSSDRRTIEDDYQTVSVEVVSGRRPRYACDFRQTLFGLPVGSWRVTLMAPTESSTCTADLRRNASGTLVRFIARTHGCKTAME